MEKLHVAEFETRHGQMRCASTERGLAYVHLPRAGGRGLDGWLRLHAPETQPVVAWEPNRVAIAQITEFLEGKRPCFDLPLDLRATPFQRLVYDALLEIPYGETRTYADIARCIGHPKAVRAVGAANGSNPIPLVIPCHRVVAAGGKLGGFGGGLPMKKQLLVMEHAKPLAGNLL
ncbi:MAG: methylated-DNA--[protein]-cysteine S-methyltransferase [bacterium]|nr:methylated-DNA--[protein]-cysteine S-methyltransferase [bacterium]MCP5069387.1 methylated-DNA--[protein]-cysteine S-methyltransferase [bacterium]